MIQPLMLWIVAHRNEGNSDEEVFAYVHIRRQNVMFSLVSVTRGTKPVPAANVALETKQQLHNPFSFMV